MGGRCAGRAEQGLAVGGKNSSTGYTETEGKWLDTGCMLVEMGVDERVTQDLI
jgi:hypothetical protein